MEGNSEAMTDTARQVRINNNLQVLKDDIVRHARGIDLETIEQDEVNGVMLAGGRERFAELVARRTEMVTARRAGDPDTAAEISARHKAELQALAEADADQLS